MCPLAGRWRPGSRCRWSQDQETPAADCTHTGVSRSQWELTGGTQGLGGSVDRQSHQQVKRTRLSRGSTPVTCRWSGASGSAGIWRSWSSSAALSASNTREGQHKHVHVSSTTSPSGVGPALGAAEQQLEGQSRRRPERSEPSWRSSVSHQTSCGLSGVGEPTL